MQIALEDHELVVRLSSLEKLAAAKFTDIRVPRASVIGVEPTLPSSSWKHLRIPGTYLPGLLKAGSFLTERGYEFWLHRPRTHKHAVTISLRDQRYRRLVLGTEDATQAERISGWLPRPPA